MKNICHPWNVSILQKVIIVEIYIFHSKKKNIKKQNKKKTLFQELLTERFFGETKMVLQRIAVKTPIWHIYLLSVVHFFTNVQ